MKQLAPFQSRLSESLASEEMTDHRYLSKDSLVQKSAWSDGTEIYVNFGDDDFDADRALVPAKGFAVRGNTPVGDVSTRIEPALIQVKA